MPITTLEALRTPYDLPQLDSRCTHFIGLSPLVVVASAGPLTDTHGGAGHG